MLISSQFVAIGQAALFLGISVVTVRRWCRDGRLLVHHRTLGHHRRFDVANLAEVRGDTSEIRQKIGYARVSSHDQKQDLIRQAERLRQADVDRVIEDLGSGLNCKKSGLRNLLNMLLNRQVSTLVLTHKDRLLRFGHELIFQICKWAGTDVLVQEKEMETTFEAELCKDVITLMTVFSARLYGKRSHKNKRKVLKSA